MIMDPARRSPHDSALAQALAEQGLKEARSGDFKAASATFRKAVEKDPGEASAHNNLGSALAALGRHLEAADAYRAALAVDPAFVKARVNLGASLNSQGRTEDAISCLTQAIEAAPNDGSAFYYLGLALQASGRLSEALACLAKAAHLRPHDGDVFVSLGAVLQQHRRMDEAIEAFRRALAIDPSLGVARTHLLFRLANDCEWEQIEAMRGEIRRLGVTGDPVPPFSLLALEDHPRRHRIRSERFAQASFAQIAPLPVMTRPANRPPRLRIGYFSADFREHATMFLAARLFEAHDRHRFSVHVYSYGRDDSGPLRGRLRETSDSFTDVRHLGHAAIAELARRDGIDIAVDLKGYTEHQRVGLFAARPAPVQATFLGYPGTLGARFIDYLVADPTVVPAAHRSAIAERIIYLPHSYQVNDDRRLVPQSGGDRVKAGLPRDGLVLCCFNKHYKITAVEFDIWMSLLRQVDGSVLWLLAGSDKAELNLRRAAEVRGVAPERLLFAPSLSPAEHLARQPLADLFLDTFNCNAHTTASDALWSGVPVLTMAGRSFAARVAASVVQAVGLGEMVTSSPDDYAAAALALARDPARLAALRARLAANRRTTPLFDSALFTRHLERGFDLAFDRYVEGKPPVDIRVPA